jgi:hypothetical protein
LGELATAVSAAATLGGLTLDSAGSPVPGAEALGALALARGVTAGWAGVLGVSPIVTGWAGVLGVSPIVTGTAVTLGSVEAPAGRGPVEEAAGASGRDVGRRAMKVAKPPSAIIATMAATATGIADRERGTGAAGAGVGG